MGKWTFFWLVLTVAAGGVLYHTSQQVTDGRTKLANLERNTQREDESLRVLQAEWSYLNQPERLEKLANEYLHMSPMKGRQFTTIDALPQKEGPAPAAADAQGAVKDSVQSVVKTPVQSTVKDSVQSTVKDSVQSTASAPEKTLAATEPAAGDAHPAIHSPAPATAVAAHIAPSRTVTAARAPSMTAAHPAAVVAIPHATAPHPAAARAAAATPRTSAPSTPRTSAPVTSASQAATRRDFLDVMKSLQVPQ